MADAEEEPQPQSIQQRIAALKLSQVGQSPLAPKPSGVAGKARPPPPPPPLGYSPGPPLGRGPPLVQCAQCGILKPVAQFAREGGGPGGVWKEECASCKGMILDTETGVTRRMTGMERGY